MKVVRALAFIIIIAILGVGGYFVMIHTDNFKSDFTTFYVNCEGERLGLENNYVYKDDSSYRFNVVYPFEFLSKEQKGFSVKVIPYREGEAVDYSVDGRLYLFSAGGEDLTSAFDISYDDNGFVLNIKKYFSIKTVLDKIYPDKSVEVVEKYIVSDSAYYTLIISSYDSSVQYNVNFGVSNRQREDVRNVGLDITRIVF